MHTYVLTALAALVASTEARVRPSANGTFDCGVNIAHADPSFLHAISNLKNDTGNSTASKSPSLLPSLLKRQMFLGTISIPTYIHIITTNASASTVTPFMVAQQVNVLNKAYNPYNIKFRTMKIDYTVNDAWAVGAGDDMGAMKAALRQGTYGALNLYFQSDLSGGGILGTCTLPTYIGDGTPAPSLYVVDGCSINAQTMPGGDIYGYNLGMTAVHEIGHWLGLLHVFEGRSCTGDGDFINDTPAQSTETNGCPAANTKDSCPAVKGYDNVNNYMDYSTDACYSKFTSGQISRIRTLWAKFRAGR